MRAEERAAAILQLLHEIERERDETSDNRRRAVLDAEAMQLRAMHSRLMAEALAGPTLAGPTLEEPAPSD